MVARCEPRGLGIQTAAVARNLSPERVLLVLPHPQRWPQHRDWYHGHDVTTVGWDGRSLDERTVRRWLSGLDVVYTAESFYDPCFADWCRRAGCGYVCHTNPEQLSPEDASVKGVSWWAATPWRLDRLPADTRLVPMPVEPARRVDRRDGPVRFVHVAGHFAAGDRNGTGVVGAAARQITEPCELTVFCQDRRLQAAVKQRDPKVKVSIRTGGVDDQADLYADGDVLVLPRRYGGLCLPVGEAMAAGLAVVLTDCSPNEVWPGPKIPVVRRHEMRARCGPVELADSDHVALARILNRLAADRGEVDRLKAEARAWAEANSWEALRSLWLEELARACPSSSPAAAAASTVNTPGGG